MWQPLSKNGNCLWSTKNELNFWENWEHGTARCYWIVSGALMLDLFTSGLKCHNTKAFPTHKTLYPLMLYVSKLSIYKENANLKKWFFYNSGVILQLCRQPPIANSVCGDKWSGICYLLCFSLLPIYSSSILLESHWSHQKAVEESECMELANSVNSDLSAFSHRFQQAFKLHSATQRGEGGTKLHYSSEPSAWSKYNFLLYTIN